MLSFRHSSFSCTLLFISLCLTMVQLAPTGRWARTADEGNKSDPVDGENIPPDDQGANLFEGDIMLSENQFEAIRDKVHETQDFKRSIDQTGSGETTLLPVTAAPRRSIHQTWPNARVPYRFHQLLAAKWRLTFVNAMNMIEEATCIRFFQAAPTEANYLFYEHAERCRSFVGRHGGAQPVSIADLCSSPGHALHEIGHALGLWHEHSRPDRDNYIEILFKNLESSFNEEYFEKTSQELFKSVPDVGYDIQSVMHYSPFAFASTVGLDKRTIIIREDADLDELNCKNRLPMGQRSQLSYKDTRRLNLLYRCSDNVTNSVVEPPCIVPTPTLSSTSPEPPSTSLPTPTTTIPTATPLSRRLKSGNVIALTIGEGSHGMNCVPSPGCTPLPCDTNSCTGPTTAVNNQFQIINQASSTSSVKKILSGATILLRSVNTPSNWLDCSNPNKCIISTCSEDNVEDLSNASYISSCSIHQFQVYGVGRQIDKLLTVEHKLQFRDKSQQSYLSCNGKRCRLLESGRCQRRQVFPVEKINGECLVEVFSVDKLSEF